MSMTRESIEAFLRLAGGAEAMDSSSALHLGTTVPRGVGDRVLYCACGRRIGGPVGVMAREDAGLLVFRYRTDSCQHESECRDEEK